MQEEIDFYIETAKESMQGALEHLARELTRVRTGKASTAMLTGVQAEFYGIQTPISQMANVTTPDARTIMIQPWDKTALTAIETAIIASNLGLNPQNDGEIIRINVPPLTEERRREMVKKSKTYLEDAKVSIRNSRRDLMEAIKQAVKDGYPEDMGKRMEQEAQNITNSYSEKADKLSNDKEKEIMTV